MPVAEVHDGVLSSPDHADRHAEHAVVRAGLARLPRRQRTVIVLHYDEDLAVGEIAAMLGSTPGTVRSQLSRARAALRVDLAAPVMAREDG